MRELLTFESIKQNNKIQIFEITQNGAKNNTKNTCNAPFYFNYY